MLRWSVRRFETVCTFLASAVADDVGRMVEVAFHLGTVNANFGEGNRTRSTETVPLATQETAPLRR